MRMKDYVQYQRVAEIPGLVLSKARFSEFSFDRHFHLDYHVGLVTEGVLRQRFKGKTVLLGPGSIALMPPGEIHDGMRDSEHAYTLKTFRLSPDLLREVAEELSGTRREPEPVPMVLEDRELADRLLRLHCALLPESGAGPMLLQSEWLTLFGQLFSRSRTVVPQSVDGALSTAQWQRVKDYCCANLAEKITLEELAALCGLGRFQFLRQFKHTVGMTPHAWLVRLRLEQACALLARKALTVAQVAQGVGFYDQSHFNRAFRQAFGVTPSSY